MAIKLECANIIIPVTTVIRIAGQKSWDEYYGIITSSQWHDGVLWREGHMNKHDLADALKDWEDRGLALLREENGKKCWRDVCIAHSHYGPSYPCDWIEYDPERNIVWKKGSDCGEAIGAPL